MIDALAIRLAKHSRAVFCQISPLRPACIPSQILLEKACDFELPGGDVQFGHKCLFVCVGRKIDGPGLPGGFIIYQGNPSISPKRTAMLGALVRCPDLPSPRRWGSPTSPWRPRPPGPA